MITSYGFNGYIKPSSNLNMLFKLHDSGYYSFTHSTATLTSNFPIEGKSGFCQVIVEEKGTMAAQYLYYHNNESFYRVGDITGAFVQWSAWNQLLSPSYFDDKETKVWANANLFPLYHDTPGVNEDNKFGDNRYWVTPPEGVHGFFDGYDKATFKNLGLITNNTLLSTLSSINFLNGWYYKADEDKGEFPIASSGILKVYSGNTINIEERDILYDDTVYDNQKRLVFISTSGAYYMTSYVLNDKTLIWNELAVAGSAMMNDLYNTAVSCAKYIKESFITDVRFGAPVYTTWQNAFGVTTGKYAPGNVFYYCVDMSYKYENTLLMSLVHRPLQYNINGTWIYAYFT